MVERLKAAIEKARQEREARGSAAPQADGPSPSPAVPAPRENPAWAMLPEFNVDPAQLERERVVSYSRDRAHVPFDLLRTRLTAVCRDRGWTRIGVSSPTKGCGKSVVSTNLAFSVARQHDSRALLVDLDLRSPRIAHILGFGEGPSTADFLKGSVPVEKVFRRFGNNLAVCANTRPEPNAAELMHSVATVRALDDARRQLDPGLVIYDLPPMLVVDDTVGFLPNLDAILLVAAAGATRARQITECEQLIGESTAFLGVVLNKAEDLPADEEGYEYYGT